MPTREEAEEHLRVIRSLMERSTIYRAISAPVALIGGLITLAACTFMILKFPLPFAGVYDLPENPFFLPVWLAVLAITAFANTYFLWRDAVRRGDKFLSPGLRAAMRALLPSCLVAMVLTILLSDSSYVLPIAWMILYGLSLLATQHFAPRSIILLGWAFLAAGLCSILGMYFFSRSISFDNPWSVASMAMGATFGLFHIIYAVCTWPRKSSTSNSGGEP